MNPVSQYPEPSPASGSQQSFAAYQPDRYGSAANDGPDDEEEMMEMMAMQEECRLEMMKFYIQSQNPNLFEEIYHDVSYPEGMKKPSDASSIPPGPEQQQAAAQPPAATLSDAADSASDQLAELSLKKDEA